MDLSTRPGLPAIAAVFAISFGLAPCAACNSTAATATATAEVDDATAGGDSFDAIDEVDGADAGAGGDDARVDAIVFADADASGRDASVCELCENAQCSTSYQACFNDPACLAIGACANACDPANLAKCLSTCRAATPAGAAEFDALAACVHDHCSVACTF